MNRPTRRGRKRLAALLITCALVSSGCQKRPTASLEGVAPTDPARQDAPAEVPKPVAVDSRKLLADQVARKLIRTATLTLEIENWDQASREAIRIAGEHGGYLADSQVARYSGQRRRGSLELRVRADRFEPAIAALRKLGEVESENVNVDDVTKAYADLETRLRVKRETETRLREILRTRTSKLSDIIEAERELARLVEEIEQAEGERRYYDQQIALSTITVELHEPPPVIREGALAPLFDALRGALRVLSGSVALLLTAAVFAAPWLLLLWLGWRLRRRLRRRRAANAAGPGSGAA